MNTKELTETIVMIAEKQMSSPTLRDFFAGCALIAYGLSQDRKPPKSQMTLDFEAGSAFKLADAMLEAREK